MTIFDLEPFLGHKARRAASTAFVVGVLVAPSVVLPFVSSQVEEYAAAKERQIVWLLERPILDSFARGERLAKGHRQPPLHTHGGH